MQQHELLEFQRNLAALPDRAPVTWALIAANVAVFAAMTLSGISPVDPDGLGHIAWGSNLVPVTVAGEWWRLGTAMFLHFGLIHLLVNMWALYAQGGLTERLFGSTRFLLLYVFAGLAGSLASAATHAAINSAGASGAIFGVVGGLTAFLLVKRNGVPMQVMRAHRASLVPFLLVNAAFGFTHPGIDNSAHVGGLLAGFLVGLALARPVNPASRARPEPARVAGIAAACALALVVACAVGIPAIKARMGADDRAAAAELLRYYREAR